MFQTPPSGRKEEKASIQRKETGKAAFEIITVKDVVGASSKTAGGGRETGLRPEGAVTK